MRVFGFVSVDGVEAKSVAHCASSGCIVAERRVAWRWNELDVVTTGSAPLPSTMLQSELGTQNLRGFPLPSQLSEAISDSLVVASTARCLPFATSVPVFVATFGTSGSG